MNILVIMKLSEKKCRDKLKPLSMVDEVQNIAVLRQTVGPPIKKVRYITPPRLIQRNSVLIIVWKIIFGIKTIKKEKINFIVSFYFLPHNIVAVVLGRLFNKPIIASLIGTDVNYWFEKERLTNIFMPILQRNSQIFVTGKSSAQKLISKGVLSRKIKILPNSIDVEKNFSYNAEKTIEFIFVGSLIEVKRVSIIIEIVETISKTFKKVKLVIVGSGSEDEKLQKQVQSMNLNSNIQFIGHTFKTDYWLNKSKILLLTSKSEGRPAVVMEAMVCGTVPVVLDVGDIKEICRSGKDSILIKNSKDFKDQFVKQITILLENDEYWSFLSSNARKRGIDFSYSSTTSVWKETIKIVK